MPTGTFTVAWNGNDQDSGVANYDVQYCVDNSEWDDHWSFLAVLPPAETNDRRSLRLYIKKHDG